MRNEARPWSRRSAFDIAEFWTDDPEFEGRARSRLGAGYGLVTGAKAGVDLLGLVGTLLGAAIVGPAVLGIAAIYGGKEVLDERRRRLIDRRQQARTFLAELVEEVRFQVDGRLTTVLDEMQRQMRARFMDRIAELHRTVGASVAALERAAKREAAERRARQAEVETTIEELDRLSERLGAVRRPAGRLIRPLCRPESSTGRAAWRLDRAGPCRFRP